MLAKKDGSIDKFELMFYEFVEMQVMATFEMHGLEGGDVFLLWYVFFEPLVLDHAFDDLVCFVAVVLN